MCVQILQVIFKNLLNTYRAFLFFLLDFLVGGDKENTCLVAQTYHQYQNKILTDIEM